MTKRRAIFLSAFAAGCLVWLWLPADAEAGRMIFQMAGSAIGNYVFPGVGGFVGGMIGGFIGGLIFPEKPELLAPKLKDREVTSSAAGEPIADSYGTISLPGYLIQSSDLLPEKHTVGGKGMNASPSGYYYTYNVHADWLFRRRPATGILRFWIQTKLVRDIREDATLEEIVAGNFKFKGGRLLFYMGAENQLPDSRMEALLGVGNVPAHRGKVRVVARRLSLDDYGNAVPQVAAEVYDSGQQNLKNFGTFTHGVSGTFNVRWTWDHVDDNGELVHLAADSNHGGAAFAPYSDNEAYFWQRSTPSGVFPEEKLLSPITNPSGSPPASGRVIIPIAGYSDEPTAFGFGANHMYLWRFNDQTETFFPYQPNWFSAHPQNYIFKNDRLFLYMAPVWGAPNKMLVEYGPTGSYLRETYILQSYALRDFDASTDYIYVLSMFLNQPAQILKISQSSLTIEDQWSTGIVGATNGISVADDDEIYFSERFSGGVRIYRTDKKKGTELIGSAPAGGGTGLGHLIFKSGLFYYGPALGSYSVIAPAAAAEGVQLMVPVGHACRVAGLPPTRFDVSELTDIVHGYAREMQMTMTDFIRPLMPHFLFDAVESGPVLKFKKRGRAVSFTIPLSDLAAYEGKGEPPDMIERTELNERMLPAIVKVKYKQKEHLYERGMQEDEWSGSDYRNVTEFDLPISMLDADARQSAMRLNSILHTERHLASISLLRKYIRMEPGDIVEIPL